MSQVTKFKHTQAAWRYIVSFGTVVCVVRCFPSSGDGSLSLANYYDQAGVSEDPVRTERIQSRLAAIKATEAYLPSVASMSATIGNLRDLSDTVHLPNGVTLYVKKNVPAEGIPLPFGHTAITSLGGCRLAIAIGGEHCLMVHIGADSLIDRKRIEGLAYEYEDGASREHESIIFAIAHFFCSKGIALSNVFIQCLFGLESYTHDLEHPTYAPYNKALLKDVLTTWQPRADKEVVTVSGSTMSLNLFQILKAQAAKVGIKHVRDDLLLPLAGRFGNTRHPDEVMRLETNLVTATRIA